MTELKLIGRENNLFDEDINRHGKELSRIVSSSSFLVVGGAGSIGRAVSKEIFRRGPRKLHIVDVSENNMVELVRDLRSSNAENESEFRTFAIDCGSVEFDVLFSNQKTYDYVFNLSALKHVRSERDPFTLMRMINVNIFNTIKLAKLSNAGNAKNYFCVSTDKAANPVNMMGASKRIMEMFLMQQSLHQKVSMARFANVAFSDGSLLHGFVQRLNRKQPITAPKDVERYFITESEAGQLCLLAGLLGKNRDIFFPKLNSELHLMKFSKIAENFLRANGFEPHLCESEDEARKMVKLIDKRREWPCYFFSSDTTGEKEVEEFFTTNEDIEYDVFQSIGVIKNQPNFDQKALDSFNKGIDSIASSKTWKKTDLVDLFRKTLPNFTHEEKEKNLDQKM